MHAQRGGGGGSWMDCLLVHCVICSLELELCGFACLMTRAGWLPYWCVGRDNLVK